MLLEDSIIRKSREKIRNAINKKFQDEGTRIYLNENMYEILDTICEFFDHNSMVIYKLSKEYRDQILMILNKKGIHLHHSEYHSLRGVVDTILKERYRSCLPFDPEINLPRHITANDIYGEYIFDDLLCLNDTDFRQLKLELLKFPQAIRTLSEMVEKVTNIREPVSHRFLSYDYHPYTKNLRRYQRLRILDEIMANATEPLTLHDIDRKMKVLAAVNGIDSETLWKNNDIDNMDRGYYLEDAVSAYKQDFLTLAELIAPSEHHNKRRKDVYRFDGFGGRCYCDKEMSAFKLVIPASLSTVIYRELIDSTGDLDEFKFWKYPLIYAIAKYGKYQTLDDTHEKPYTIGRIQEMKYYKTGSIWDYDSNVDSNRPTVNE